MDKSKDERKGVQPKMGEKIPFIQDLDLKLMGEIYNALDLEDRAIALISEDLRVLRQTRACEELLAEGVFYALEDVLTPEICDEIASCLKEKQEQKMHILIEDRPFRLKIVPLEGQRGMLVLDETEQRYIGVNHVAAKIRNSLFVLQNDVSKERIYMETMRIMRQINHLETLLGARDIKNCMKIKIHLFLNELQTELNKINVHVRVIQPKDNFTFPGDPEKLICAVLTLISNSLRHSRGEEIQVTIDRECTGRYFMLCVQDNGSKTTEETMKGLSNAWREPDGLPFGWGMGIPYAKCIVEMHGGRLEFRHINGGNTACIMLPIALTGLEQEEAEMKMGYLSLSGGSPAEIELADALTEEHYRV